MVYNRFKGFRNFYYLTLAAILVAFFWVYLFITMVVFHSNEPYDWERYLLYQIVAVLGLFLASLNAGRINGELTRCDVVGSNSLAFRNIVYISGAVLLVLVLIKDARISRLFLFSFLPLLYLIFLAAHRLLPKFLLRTLFSGRRQHRILLVGPPEKAQELKLWCQQTAELGLDIANFYEHPHRFQRVQTLPDPDELEHLERVVRQEGIQQIILLELPLDRAGLEETVRLTDRLGIRLLVVNNLPEMFRHPISQFNLYGIEFIGVRDEPLEEPINRLIKRGLDLAISIPVVLFVLPALMVLVAVLHRLQSPGPLFYRQTRRGFSQQRFRILKFRTMDCKARSGRQATVNDARVFPAGRWLRRMSLDEFPQFINVLRGEMSVVGPRPHMLMHERRFCEALESYLVRCYVKPGITGLAQVRGFRGEATSREAISERVRYDTAYLEFWSIWRDLQILLETIRQIFYPPTSAY